jgi:multidrug efflux pump
LGRGRSVPVQFVIGGTDYAELARWRDLMLEKMSTNPRLLAVDSDYQETKPQLSVQIDRTRAADLGVSIESIGHTLETMLGSRRQTTYLDRGKEYDVILRVRAEERARPDDLTNIYVRSERTGALIPLSNLIKISEIGGASTLKRFNRLRAITLSANVAPGYSLGEALSFLETTARETLPAAAQIDYRGDSRTFKQSGRSLYFTFVMALIVVFLVLSAQFESFVHPFVILLTVPLAVAGGLFGLYMTGSTLNIYSQIGVVILIGLASKNGILIVEFANQLRDAGKAFREALLEAASIRLRPIIMTSVATAVGALPLVLATGAGAASRFTIGIVIFTGVLFATLLTVFVVPVVYELIARGTTSPEAVARKLATLESHPERGVSAGE